MWFLKLPYMAANTNPTTSLKNQSAVKYLPKTRYLSNFEL